MKPSTHSDSLDIGKLRQWIGREQESQDLVTPRLIAQLNACFDDPGAAAEPAPEQSSFPGLHWVLAPDNAPLASLDEDGHIARGGFLPPVPLPHRMWAGGQLQHLDPLRLGDTVWRRSRVEDVTVKQGRSGVLCFVAVRHEFTTARGMALTERQDIVYRDQTTTDTAARGNAGMQPGTQAAHESVPMVSRTFDAGPVLLFRYSAVTFNGHRIHYDHDYCRTQGYPGLLVHGPLQATLLLRLGAALHHGALPRVFSYRSLRPLFAAAACSVNAARQADGLELWTADGGGAAAMQARAAW